MFHLVALALPLIGLAVEPYAPRHGDPVVEPWRWRSEVEMSDFGALCMDEASDGSLWFGCTDGLIHYDGVSIREIKVPESVLAKISSVKSSPWTKSLLVMPDGSVLALVGESLLSLKGGEWRILIQDVGPSIMTARMAREKNGVVWLMTPRSLWRISADARNIEKIVEREGETKRLETFCLGENGTVWALERVSWDRMRLLRIHAERRSANEGATWREVPFLYERGRFSMAARPDGTLVFASTQRVTPLYVYDPRTDEWEAKGDHERMSAHSSAITGPRGGIWFGLRGGVGYLTRQGELIEYDEVPVDLPAESLSLFMSSRERLWLIGRIGQVYSVDLGYGTWKTYAGLNFAAEDAEGARWFTTADNQHVVSHDPKTDAWSRYGPEDGLIEKIRCLEISNDGAIWAAGQENGRAAVAVFDGRRWHSRVYADFASEARKGSLFEAGDGTFWLGAQGRMLEGNPKAGGALRLGVDADARIDVIERWSGDEIPYYITALTQTADEALWMGSTIVHSMDARGVVTRHPELGGENVVAMTVDREDSVWLAKEYFGVCRWKDGRWTVFGKADGLAGLKLSDLRVLKDGSIIVASSGGISRYDGVSWASRVYPKWFNMFSRWSGLKEAADGSRWLNYSWGEGIMPKIIVDSRGFGAIHHQPDRLAPDTVFVEYLDRISRPGNGHVSWSARDPWGDTPSSELAYSWRLNGEEWSPFSRETGKTFLNLASGNYSLEVRALDREFNVDPTPARIDFVVVPPIWRRLWFVAMLSFFALLVLGLTALLIRNREKYLRGRQAEREAFLESRRVEREKHLLEMDRLKTGFFTNISHELRTPVTVILGRLERLLEMERDEGKKRMLSAMEGNATRVATLVTQLLDFRKIQEGKIEVERARGDLVPMMRRWVEDLRPLAEDARVVCRFEGDARCDGSFDFDKTQKIFTNLVSNAIKYTQAGGEVRIALRVNEQTAGRSTLKLSVEDDGVGIAAEHLDHVFDRFYRVSEGSLAVGAGIGLNLTREMVDLLDGEIEAESPIHANAEHPGARFTVTLPFESHAPESGRAPRKDDRVGSESAGKTFSSEEADAGGENSTISAENKNNAELLLIVEDDDDICRMLESELGETYRVAVAKNGAEGLEKAKELVPDLVISDLMMPIMDGLELCEKLKTSVETSHVPIVLLTAKAALESRIDGFEHGADDYITKPFNLKLLRARIANLLETRRALRETFANGAPLQASDIPADALDKAFIEEAMRVLEENYSEWEFGPDEFAAGLSMSRSTLRRKLKAVTNRTPSAFMNEFRVTKAAEMLVSTTKTVKEIVFDVGYEEPANFSRLFKKHYETTPTRYREAHRPR